MANFNRVPIMERFNSKYAVNQKTGCWEWTASCNQSGYGMIAKGGKPTVWIMAHRLSFSEFNGEILPGMYVCHKCDNRKCVNPNHLFLGTPSENVADKNAKGRGNYSRHNAKLTDDQVREIIALLNSGQGSRSIAAKFGVSRHVPNQIRAGRTYRHITTQAA